MVLYWDKKEDLREVNRLLDANQILLSSGDTVLGISAALSQEGYDELNRIKQRSGMPCLVLVHSADRLKHFIDQELTDKLKELTKMAWPGPITLIFKARKELPDYMKSEKGTIAIRVPDHDGLLMILRHRDGLFSTSANLHGQPVVYNLEDVDSRIKDAVGGICLDSDHLSKLSPSAILDCSENKITVIRSSDNLKNNLKYFLD